MKQTIESEKVRTQCKNKRGSCLKNCHKIVLQTSFLISKTCNEVPQCKKW